MNKSTFIYVTYIRTTPEKLWHALTNAEIIAQWWFDARCESDWMVGSSWTMRSADGVLYDSGKVLESIPGKRLAFNWTNEWKPEFKAEGTSICTYEIEPMGEAVKLTITHTIDRANSKFFESISVAWPMTISNLKSLLETGEVALGDNPRHSH